jgi:histidine ammonia-lyase
MQLPAHISLDYLKNIGNTTISLSPDAHNRIAHNRAYLDAALSSGNIYYGINTGFGSLCNVRIDAADLAQLQENLVCSHACGMGDETPEPIVRLMLLLKAHGLSQGYSGVRPEIVQRLMDFYNLVFTP